MGGGIINAHGQQLLLLQPATFQGVQGAHGKVQEEQQATGAPSLTLHDRPGAGYAVAVTMESWFMSFGASAKTLDCQVLGWAAYTAATSWCIGPLPALATTSPPPPTHNGCWSSF